MQTKMQKTESYGLSGELLLLFQDYTLYFSHHWHVTLSRNLSKVKPDNKNV